MVASGLDEHVELVFEEDISGKVDQEMTPSLLPVRSFSPNGRSSSRVSGMSGSWTFPLDANRSELVADVDLDDMSSGTERLIPEAHVLNEKRGEFVKVNQAYG